MIFRCESCDQILHLDANPGFCLVCGQGPILELICLTRDEARQIEGAVISGRNYCKEVSRKRPPWDMDQVGKDGTRMSTALALIRAKMESSEKGGG